MSVLKQLPAHWPTIQRILRWSGLSLGPATGSAFLTVLLVKLVDKEQLLHTTHPWLFLLLPFGAMAIYYFQRPFPQKALPLALPGLHEKPSGIPRYSIPFIYGSTLLTHFFGASAGREGAGFQAATDIGQRFAAWYGPKAVPKQVVLSASVAAAFGVVFGTPITAAIFALELFRFERFPLENAVAFSSDRTDFSALLGMRSVFERFPYNMLVPCGLGGLAGLGVTILTGIRESQFKYLFDHTLALSFNDSFHLDLHLLVVTFLLAIILGILSCAFTELTRQLRYVNSRLIQPRWLTPLAASTLLALLGYFTPARDYLGLGILPATPHSASILTSFQSIDQSPFAWFWKLTLTLLTLAAGFRGGEIAPLLFMSTALAHALLPLAGVNLPLLCALAFIGILSAAANTPFAAIFLSVELFGGQYIVYFTFCCLIAYFISPPTKQPGKPAIRGIPKLFIPTPTLKLYHSDTQKKP